MNPEILLAEPRGFCAGVERALQTVEKALSEGPFPVYVLHEIVHNECIVNELKKRGVRFINEPEEADDGGTLIFSAHGVSRDVEERAAKLSLKVIDAACPIVKALHRKMEQFSLAGKEIILFGRKGHREVEGLLGRVSTPVHVIESQEGLQNFLAQADRKKSYACLSQTTLNADDIHAMTEELKKALPDLEVSAEVCFATRDRQNAVRDLAACCDLILVAGSQQSSNTKRLLDVALRNGVKAYLLPDAGSLRKEWLQNVSAVGITAGASAPESLVKELTEKIRIYTQEQ
ncbi:MAG: 4-hydroxy-3-methylbut-2-enyl diphosphate reductase [Lentisphaeria bacterium]|nr:4-hydroxy-3-methylbut-2-enyl diphosphate reductase [Lentisphaeria bacterium]